MDPKTSLILYVDDEAANRLIFERTFEHAFTVRTVEDGKQALALLEKEPVAVLLADQRLPGMLGTELLALVKEKHPHVVRLILTAYSEMSMVLMTLNEGLTSRYILKPWSREQLKETLGWALELHRVQSQVDDLQIRLLQAERLSTIGTLLASIAHEIRNPLSYMSSYVESLDRTIKAFQGWVGELRARPAFAPAFALPHAELVISELAALPGIVADLNHGFSSVFTLLQALQSQAHAAPEKVRRADALRALQYAYRLTQGAIVGHGGLLTLDAETGLPEVAISAVELSQILLNLLTNAAHSLEKSSGEKRVTLSAKPAGEGLEFAVADTGLGMEPEVQKRLFEQYFTTKAAGVGTGLGLSTCRRILEGIGGKISFTSERGRGTTFRFWVPLAP